MTPIPPNILSCFRRNLEAVDSVNTELACLLRDFVWPAELKFIRALDDTPTAYGPTLSKSGWFGASGAPKIREQVLCEQFVAGTSNVIFAGVGQGFGLRLLLDRLAPYQMIFVWEPELAHIAILLGLYDFSADLSSRRLVFLTEPAIKTALVNYFSEHPEFSPPMKMLGWPWLGDAQLAQLSRGIEEALGEITPNLNQKAGAAASMIEQYGVGVSGGKIERVAIVSLVSQWQENQLARDLAWAAEKNKLHAGLFQLDRPEHGSSIGLIRFLAEFKPQALFSVGVGRSKWTIEVPGSLPFFTFLCLPGTVLGEKIVSNLGRPGENERWVLGSRQDAAELAKNVGEGKCFFLEAAVNPEVFRPVDQIADCQLAVFADRPEMDPLKLGIRQRSHQELWREVGRLIARNPLSYHTAQAEVLVSKVSNITGIKLSDPELLKSFVQMVRSYLGPAMSATSLVEELIRSGLKIRIFGSGWENVEQAASLSRSVPERSQEINDIFNRSEAVLVVDHESNRRGMVLDALTAGRIVLVKRLPDDSLAGIGLPDESLVYLEPAVDVLSQWRKIQADRRRLKDGALRAREFLVEHFSFAEHLRKIIAG